MKRKMKQKNKSLFIRLLSCVLVMAMVVPLCAMLMPFTAFATDDSADEITDTSPTVSLAWTRWTDTEAATPVLCPPDARN